MDKSINLSEVKKFSDMASKWWDYKGPLKTLHDINHCRVKYIVDKLRARSSINGLEILDVGCGGGLVCEPLSRLGASVTGIDASKENIKIASEHAKLCDLDIKYQESTIELHLKKNKKYDCIVCLEVLEHVDNVSEFISSCCKALKKGGVLFFSTINRNLKSYLTSIVVAEYVLRWLPTGTHDWQKFLKPSEVVCSLEKDGVIVQDIKGLKFKPISSKNWALSNDIDVNYILYAIKE